MVIVTSCLAFLIGMLPIRRVLSFRPRYHSISICVYWLSDLARGILATLLAWMLAGLVAAYFAAVLVVFASLLSISKGNSLLVAAGAILILSPSLLLIGTAAFLISLFITRYLFLSTCLTVIAVLLFGIVLTAHITIWFVLLCMGCFVCYQQRHNFRKYRRGIEKPIKW